MDVMLVQYGPPHVHKTEEARSRFFSPVSMLRSSHDVKAHYDPQIFNHLVKQFSFMLRSNPETIIAGRIGTRGRIEYFFQAFGAIAILCIEMKLKVGNEEERLDAIAQAISECDGKLNNVLPT
jgi:hypothetical protein